MKTAATIDTSDMNEPAAALARASAVPPQPAHKPISAKELEAAATAHTALMVQIGELEELQPGTAKKFDVLCASCDLEDKGALAEIARLQILVALLPKRIEARQDAALQSARELSGMVGNFIHHTLGPRVRDLRAKAEAEVRTAIAKLVSDEFLLNRAVLESDPVSAIAAIYTTWNTSGQPETAAAEVHRILASFETLVAFEKINAKAIKQAGKISYTESFVQNMERQKKLLAGVNEAGSKSASESAPKAHQVVEAGAVLVRDDDSPVSIAANIQKSKTSNARK